MDAENLKAKIDIAKEVVKDLDEPLKTKAFEVILNNLLSRHHKVSTGSITPSTIDNTLILEKNLEEDKSDKLMNLINSTVYSSIYNLQKALDKALYVLSIAKNDHGIDGLNPSQISKILTLKFRIPATPNAVGMALMKAGNLADRRRINTTGGLSFEYRIMHVGELHINKILDEVKGLEINVPDKKQVTLKNKKNKAGLKVQILKLKEEKFFEKPKEANEVMEELDTKGFRYNEDPIRTALLRLVKKGILKRTKEMKNNKEIYRYCNT